MTVRETDLMHYTNATMKINHSPYFWDNKSSLIMVTCSEAAGEVLKIRANGETIILED